MAARLRRYSCKFDGYRLSRAVFLLLGDVAARPHAGLKAIGAQERLCLGTALPTNSAFKRNQFYQKDVIWSDIDQLRSVRCGTLRYEGRHQKETGRATNLVWPSDLTPLCETNRSGIPDLPVSRREIQARQIRPTSAGARYCDG